jgi:AmmeMemoRadiSam system protein A
MADAELGRALLSIARDTLDRAFGSRGSGRQRHAALDAPGATFVTLMQQGELRGCIGTLKAHRSLKNDVAQNALAAAFHDPRFTPLTEDEWPRTYIEVSLLSPPAPMAFADESDLLRQLVPGVDGVVLEWRGTRATFLPQVWASLPEPREFVAALKGKAGLASGFWQDGVRVSRYTVHKWKETELAAHSVHA